MTNSSGRQQVAAPAQAPQQALSAATSNIVAVPAGLDAALTEGQRRKRELQAEALAQLQAERESENAWFQDTADTPSNLVSAGTPAEFKRLIVEASSDRLVVVDYFKPSCGGCRRLFPKLVQVAATNPDALFIKVNVESPEMRELGQGMQVTHLPWFHLFRSGDLVASFSANVSTVSQLRAEIATNKPCTAPGCSL